MHETAIIEQINNLNKAKLDLRNQELNLAKDLVSIEHDFLDAKNLYDLNKKSPDSYTPAPGYSNDDSMQTFKNSLNNDLKEYDNNLYN